ncbi:MAG: hypothetical protein IJ791_10650 [Lachnospiraceae bacterium]|nr:hypothetical protein [Lachnospiraceae bacterium]
MWKKKTLFFLITYSLLLAVIIVINVWVDPFMHYHAPLADSFYYELDNERSMNDGITRHFDYDAIITGTSMSENFMVSEAEELWDYTFCKIPFSGGSYKEVDDAVERALHRKDVKLVIRSIDPVYLMEEPDAMADFFDGYPDYLCDDSVFNDVEYVLNKDVLLGRSVPMLAGGLLGRRGIASLDGYANNSFGAEYGAEAVLAEHKPFTIESQQVKLTDIEKAQLNLSIEQNLIDVPQANPQTCFCYFIPPYSAVYWGDLSERGDREKIIDAEEYLVERLLEQSNVKAYAWDTDYEVTQDLDNYKDYGHYSGTINSWILQQIKSDHGLITKDNCKAYFDELRSQYANYDYNALFTQLEKE